MTILPLACSTDIVIQNSGKEILIYNLKKHKVYNLNETSAIIYNACDGKTSFEELKEKHNFTDELIFFALDELKKENLIEDDSYASPFAGMSRREVIKKIGLGSLVALPLISFLVAPTVSQTTSTCNTGDNCNCFFPLGTPDPATCKSDACTGGCDCQVASCFENPSEKVCFGQCGTIPPP